MNQRWSRQSESTKPQDVLAEIQTAAENLEAKLESLPYQVPYTKFAQFEQEILDQRASLGAAFSEKKLTKEQFKKLKTSVQSMMFELQSFHKQRPKQRRNQR